jgi:hypothetical protein
MSGTNESHVELQQSTNKIHVLPKNDPDDFPRVNVHSAVTNGHDPGNHPTRRPGDLAIQPKAINRDDESSDGVDSGMLKQKLHFAKDKIDDLNVFDQIHHAAQTKRTLYKIYGSELSINIQKQMTQLQKAEATD